MRTPANTPAPTIPRPAASASLRNAYGVPDFQDATEEISNLGLPGGQERRYASLRARAGVGARPQQGVHARDGTVHARQVKRGVVEAVARVHVSAVLKQHRHNLPAAIGRCAKTKIQ